MHFLIISKKPNFKENHINDDVLNKIDATSLISNSVVKYELGKFIIYIYNYNHVYEETEEYSYHFDENQVLIANGIFNIDDSPRNNNIVKLFDDLNDDCEIIGDYQLISLNKNGDGFCKTPLSSVKKLFYYEDDFCSAISSELKLIVEGISLFTKSSFVHNFDSTYMYDTFHSGAFLKFPRHTIFKNVKRVFPHDTLIIKNYNFLIVENESILPPKWFIELYEEDKDKLYDWYYDKLINYTEMLLTQYKDEISHISLGLTGGFDSRVSVVILNKVCKKLEIPLKTFTSGNDDHPDVIVAKQIAEYLDLDWTHRAPVSKEHPSCQNIHDYCHSFYVTQGDFDSRDFIKHYKRELGNSTGISQKGMDAYKRGPMTKICSGNIWFSRVILFMNNFFLPLFFTDYELWFGRLFYEVLGNVKIYKEYVYNILKRADSGLLDIPFAGDYLPQVDVKGIDQGNALATVHKRQPFYWDYNLVLKSLKPCLRENFNYLSSNQKHILQEAGINELDFVLLKEINADLEKYRENIDLNDSKIIEKLVNKFKSLKENSLYPKNESFIEFKKDKNYGYMTRLTQWMDYACAADANSFVELEKNASFSIESDKKKFKQDYDVIKESKLFDENWYRSQYSIDKSDDCILHYLRIGVDKGFNPSNDFDSNWYLLKNGDVKRAGINPFVHYIKYGQYEVRSPKFYNLSELLKNQSPVIKGLNNYLFPLFDDYDEINQHFNPKYMNQFSISKFNEELECYKDLCDENNIDFFDFFIPDRSVICKSKLPFSIEEFKRNVTMLSFPDFSDSFRLNHYYPHDSHLTLTGYEFFVYNCLHIIDESFTSEMFNESISKLNKTSKVINFDLLEDKKWISLDSIKKLKKSDIIEVYDGNCTISNDILDTFKIINGKFSLRCYSEESLSNSKAIILYDGDFDLLKELFSIYFKEVFFYSSHEISATLIKWFSPDVVIRIFDEKSLEEIYKD